MLWFNSSPKRNACICLGFQYILCYGSTKEVIVLDERVGNFNTSYVMVQLNPGP